MTSRLLNAAIGRTPRTAALFSGAVASPRIRLDFADLPNITRAFAPMVREARYDVSEMAIATFLQAKEAGRPLVLLPVVLTARSQEASLLCRADSGLRGPSGLVGRRVGVRAYSQTTGLWLRGVLAESHGVPSSAIHWTTFEDAHEPGFRDPPWAERAPPGSDMVAMLRDGALDAAIFGSDAPGESWLRPVFSDPAAAGEEFRRRHGFTPINHLLTLRRDLAAEPGLVPEMLRLFAEASRDCPPLPTTRAALEPAIALAIRYAVEQGLLRRPLTLDEVWEGSPA
jgi:4,5-dihydroxyphthalate decarboxylase